MCCRVRLSEVCSRFKDISQASGPLLWSSVSYYGPAWLLGSLSQWLGKRAGFPSRCPQSLILVVDEDSVQTEEEDWDDTLGLLRLCLPWLLSLELHWATDLVVGALLHR